MSLWRDQYQVAAPEQFDRGVQRRAIHSAALNRVHAPHVHQEPDDWNAEVLDLRHRNDKTRPDDAHHHDRIDGGDMVDHENGRPALRDVSNAVGADMCQDTKGDPSDQHVPHEGPCYPVAILSAGKICANETDHCAAWW